MRQNPWKGCAAKFSELCDLMVQWGFTGMPDIASRNSEDLVQTAKG